MMVESEDISSATGFNGAPQEHMHEIDLKGHHATVIKINRFGTAVAIGTVSGDIVIVDYTTKIIVMEFKDHALPVCSIDWSSNGQMIASASENGNVSIYDVVRNQCLLMISYPTINNQVLFHPRDNNIVTMLKIRDASLTALRIDTQDVKPYDYRNKGPISDDIITSMAYCQKGKYLIAGTNKSHLILFDANTFKYFKHVKQANNHQVRQIYVSRKTNLIATNSADRNIRLFRLDNILSAKTGELVQHEARYNDAISKRNYMFIGMSPDARYLCATEQSAHEITIWDLQNHSVTTPLRGVVGEAPSDLQWHTTRQEILTVARGKVHVFGRKIITTMTAFAPDFKEINDNFTHVEKEGEFDLFDEDAEEPVKAAQDDVEVDIETVAISEMAWKSSDEEDYDLAEAEKAGKAPLIMIPASLDIIYDPDEDSDPEYDRLEPEIPSKKNDDDVFVKPYPPVPGAARLRLSDSSSASNDFKAPKPKRPRHQ